MVEDPAPGAGEVGGLGRVHGAQPGVGEIALESAEAGGMMQLAADQDELVTSAKAHRLLGWTPRHTSFTDAPTRHYLAWKAARPVSTR